MGKFILIQLSRILPQSTKYSTLQNVRTYIHDPSRIWSQRFI